MIIGKLVKERYFHDVNDSGLYYDLAPLKRAGGDEADFNARIDSENNRLQTLGLSGKALHPTIYLLDSQLNNLTDHWKNILAPKSYLMIYRPGVHPSEINIQYWNAYGNDVFWWASDDVVYSKYDANGLSHRYRIAKEAEVNGTADPTTTPDYPEPYPDVIVAEPVKKWRVTGRFGWLGNVDLTVEAEE